MRLAGKDFSLPRMPAGKWQGSQKEATTAGLVPRGEAGAFAFASRECCGTAPLAPRQATAIALARPLAALRHPDANHTRQSGRQDGGSSSPRRRRRSGLFPRLDYRLESGHPGRNAPNAVADSRLRGSDDTP
jgi:hypothetical protein